MPDDDCKHSAIQMTCYTCGSVEAESPDAHLSSSEHRNAVEIDYYLRERFYLPAHDE